MKIIVAADEHQKNEIASQQSTGAEVVWVKDATVFSNYEADVFIDLQFENNKQDLQLFESLLPKPIIINSVVNTLAETNESFVRINGWPTFLQGELIEASANKCDKHIIEKVFHCFNKKVEWTADVPGFISARVISMIINEAYFTLQEDVSSKDEIDIAMKLGTNYPYGPFEWAEKIGLKTIVALLQKLAENQIRYSPAPMLVQEALNC